MRIHRPLALASALAATLILAAPPARAGELAGVKMEDSVSVGGKTLKLNGMGLRKKAFFKVYVGGLYLEAPSKDANAVLAADSAKEMRMHFLRSIDRQKLVDAYKEGFEANAPQLIASQKANLDKFYGWVTDVKDGSVFSCAYVPGTGTIVSRDGKEAGTIAGKEFADALFRLWLGPKPPSEDLKNGLLGK